MTLEAAAGKNPVTHAGKLYQLAAAEIAGRIVRECAGASDAACLLVSRIGRPIADPQILDVSLGLDPDAGAAQFEEPVRRIAFEELHRWDQWRSDLLAGRLPLY